jgi:hypothetical protein
MWYSKNILSSLYEGAKISSEDINTSSYRRDGKT